MSDLFDPGLSVSARGVIAQFHSRGVLDWGDVHTAQQVCYLYREQHPDVCLALALTIRALRMGSVCLDLDRAADSVLGTGDASVDLPGGAWPEPDAWRSALAASPAVSDGADAPSDRPLRLIGHRLYLERYWCEEEKVRHHLTERARRPLRSSAAAQRHLDRLFPEPEQGAQRQAAERALASSLTVVAGGPGTGKTTTIARILVLLARSEPGVRIALAASTGKAATRLDQALDQSRATLPPADSELLTGLSASTLHRLLGRRRGQSRFIHNAANPLPYDVIVVDETSMISLTLMSALLDAAAPDARLILVGDPDQLASVEAGAVLADVTGAGWPNAATTAEGTNGPVIWLRHNFRFGGSIGALAHAIRDGDGEAAVAILEGPDPQVSLVTTRTIGAVQEQVVRAATAVDRAARDGDVTAAVAALDAHRLLCAHRQGPFGVSHWSRIAEHWLRDAIPDFGHEGEWYTGRPLMVTENNADLGLYNGDTGVVIRIDGRPRVAFATGETVRTFSPYLLAGGQTVLAMTVHKAQGSQFGSVSIVLPPADSPLLTRELLYTAVTRARHAVTLVGSADAVRRAIAQRALRASGLRERL